MRKNQYGYEKKTEQINLVAHDKILTFENFRYLLEALEEYIEKVGYYPDFKNKRQFRQLTIKKTDIALYQAENLFRTKLLMFVGIISDDTPDDTKKEVKEEFWKWINIVGIDANNCPDEKLKHFLLEINNVIEGNSEKIVSQTQEYLDSKQNNDPTNPEDMEKVMKIFSYIQGPLDDKRDQAELYKDKNYFEVENENKIRGNPNQGEQVYNQLTGIVANRHNDFDFFSEQKRQQAIKEKERAQQDYRQWEQEQEIFSSTSSGSTQQNNLQQDENSKIIRNVRNNRNSWKIEVIQGQNWLIHNSAQRKDSEIGHLIHPKQRFTDYEWAEIRNVLNSSWGSLATSYDLPHNFDNRQNYSIEVAQSTVADKPQKDNKNDKVEIIATISIFTALVVGGIVLVAKKQLNKKIKK